jgi:septal ring factor EnvC (AmiA/AmiB activator)
MTEKPLWESVPEHVRLEPRPPVVEQPKPPPKPRRRWLGLAVVAVAALAAWAGWATYAMLENEQRAVSWQKDSRAVSAHAQRLDATLAARTKALNDRVDQLNILGARLADQQAALRRSEGDVSSLEARQRQLANEKAQLEDRARVLTAVARSYSTCKQDLIDLLTAVEDHADSSTRYDTADSSCALADDQLQAYLHAF